MEVGDVAINFSSCTFALFPTPIEMIFTESSLSFLIGSLKVLIPPVLWPSVIITNTFNKGDFENECQYPSNRAPTPPLTQQKSTDDKLTDLGSTSVP